MKTTTSLHKALLIALILTTASITGNSQPLVQAALSGDASRVKQLLAEGADINQTNSRGNTALGVAVLFQYKPVVDVLLAEGADVNFTR
ncbi:MAG TPA: ankyrin repeat domain-containing protein, partial [Verrucomicrobiae bacterium]|nr:ankyrin repeat domain-containing protein [Verrucomicrobiae bacterium]